MGARLVGRNDPEARFELKGARITIGSDPDNLVALADVTVSRQHAIVQVVDHRWIVTDAGSTNGTFLNDRRVTSASPLRDGDELRFGALSFVFKTSRPRATRTAARDSRLLWAGAVLSILFLAGLTVALFTINFNRLDVLGGTPTDQPLSGSIAASPSPVATPDDAGPSGPWLEALNQYRAMAHLGPVRANARLSKGTALHSRFLAINYADDIRRSINLGGLMHHEDPTKPGFTPEGAAAGLAGDVDEMWDPGGTHGPGWAVDDWMLGPFHRLSLLDPRLRGVGYGDYCQTGVCIATLNAQDDLAPARPGEPVMYPPNGASIRRVDLIAEWPNPLTSCNGHQPPVGLPITAQMGFSDVPVIKSFAVTRGDGQAVEACGIDSTDYANPDSATQAIGRELLREYGAIIIIPRHPLVPGHYTVKLSASGRDYQWSFIITPGS